MLDALALLLTVGMDPAIVGALGANFRIKLGTISTKLAVVRLVTDMAPHTVDLVGVLIPLVDLDAQIPVRCHAHNGQKVIAIMVINVVFNMVALHRVAAPKADHREPVRVHRTGLGSHPEEAGPRLREQDTPHVGATPLHPEAQSGHHEGAITPLVVPDTHLDQTDPSLRRVRATAQTPRRKDRPTLVKAMPKVAKAPKETAKVKLAQKYKKTAAFGSTVSAINQLPTADSFMLRANRAQFPGKVPPLPLLAPSTLLLMMTTLQ